MSIKAQTTMIFIVVIMVIFVVMGIFLLSLAKTVSQSEYINIYAHNLLSSILRTDTGLTEPSCKTVADLLACSFLTPSFVCENGKSCNVLAEEKINGYMTEFSLIKESFSYLLTVEPEGFVALPNGGDPYTIMIGDETLEDSKTEKVTANERIQRILGGNPYILNIHLIMAVKD